MITKKQNNMKRLYKYLLLLFIPLLANCSDNDNWKIVEDIQQGTYISGSATSYSGEAPASALNVISLDQDEKNIPELVGIYTWLKSEGDFNISIATELNNVRVYGNGGEEKKEDNLFVYKLEEDATPLKVEKDGFYFIVVNTALKEVNILPINFGVIGAATPNGWDAETLLGTATYDGSLKVSWNGKLNMTPAEYKFRYGGDWGNHVNIQGGETARIYTDLGGLGDDIAPLIEKAMTQVTPSGGSNFEGEYGGEYEFTIVYDLRSRIFNVTFEIIGEAVTPPEYPESLFLVGDATAYDWATPGTHIDAGMHKIAGGTDGVYWKILTLEAGKGFKISASGWSDPNLGYGEISDFDEEGVAISEDGGNLSVSETNIYMVVVDLRDNSKKLSVTPAKVYGMGDAFGGWDSNKAENLFKVDLDNKALISPALIKDDNIRMYTSHHWISDWWKAEFNLFDTKIEYRNDGGDQESVAGSIGNVITLHFDDNTGSIE